MSFNSLPLQNNQYGNFNYLLNGNFDRLDAFAAQVTGAQNWNAYKDAAAVTPVDGTGGSPTIINNAVVSASTLRGIRSWTITKTGNAQGEGYSSDFTIDAADKNRSMTILFDFSSGSAFTAGDLAVYIYDITNATLITPSNVTIPGGAGTFVCNWVSTTSTSYRLIFHCAASNATTSNWSVELDNIRVSSQNVILGAAIQDWATYTPTWAGLGSATFASNKGWYRRVGDTLELLIKANFNASGSGATTVTTTLPLSLAMNSTIVDEFNSRWQLGINAREHSGAGISPAEVYASDVNNLRFGIAASSATMVGTDITNGDTWAIRCVIPIASWTSNVYLSNNITEYAYNTNTADADDTTSFGYGPQGQVMPTVGFTASRTKTVRFQTPIQPTDIIQLEVSPDGKSWSVINGASTVATDAQEYVLQNASTYGMGVYAPGSSTTDVKVRFGQYVLASGATYGAAGTSWTASTGFWRVRKSASSNNIQVSGNILGTYGNTVQTAGYVGEVISATNSAGVSPSSGVVTNLTNITLTPGSWIVTGFVTFSGSTISQVQGMISTTNNSQSGQLYDGSTTTISYVSGSIASTSFPVGPQIWRVAAGSTQQLFLNAQTATSGSPVAKGSISATRFM